MGLRKNSKYLSRPAVDANTATRRLSEQWILTIPSGDFRHRAWKRRGFAPGSFPHRKALHQFLINARFDDDEIRLNLDYLWASWQRWLEAQRSPDPTAAITPRVFSVPVRRKTKWLSR